MATELILGDELFGNEDDAELSEWLVADGSVVAEGQAVAVLETSKVVVEVHASASGVIRHLKKTGDVVAKNAVVATIE